MVWVRADPWSLSDAAREATQRRDLVGLCGEPRDGGLLPPSWADVVAASEYGWSRAGPSPEDYVAGFYRSFYGSAEVGQARDLLERAVACLPRRTALAELFADAVRPAPGAPRADLASLVEQASAKAATATRNKELAALLAQSGNRVLAAARNVTTARRVRELYAEAARREKDGRRADVAQCLSEMAACLTEGGAALAALLGPEAAAPAEPGTRADARLYGAAAAAARKLSEDCARGASLPEPGRFWRTLAGDLR
jgi:hypothetical protein